VPLAACPRGPNALAPGDLAKSSFDLLRIGTRSGFWKLGSGGASPLSLDSLGAAGPGPGPESARELEAVGARVIQRAWRTFARGHTPWAKLAARASKALSSLIQLSGSGGDSPGPSLSFEAVAQRLRAPATLDAVSRLFARLSLRLAAVAVPCAPLSPRVFLAAPMFVAHPNEIASPRDDSIEVVSAAFHLLEVTPRLLAGAPGALPLWAEAWSKYRGQFNRWKNQDAAKLVEEVIVAAASHE